MEYRVVFDVTQSGYRDWVFAAPGLLFVAVGISMVYSGDLSTVLPKPLAQAHDQWREKVPLGFGLFWLAFSVLWTSTAFYATYHHYAFARDALKSGKAQMLEGTVDQFVSVGLGKGESFVVAGRRFDYSDYWITGCFNNTNSFWGPIHEGIQVRIWAVGNCIVKLEVATTAKE